MIRVKHVTSEQLNQLVGKQLGAKLWVIGMMNELRRYPNEIPCESGEIPSMRIPFASGDEKVEWGFTAGMSCLRQNPDGSILVQNAEHFPSCAMLALLSLLHDAGAADGAEIALTLQLPESPQISDFKKLLTEAEASLKTVTITKKTVQKHPESNTLPDRTALSLGNSIGVVQMLNQTDVGRFAAKVRCVNGSFRVGDDLTVTDGGFRVLQEHCPVTQIVSTGNKLVQSSDDLDEDVFFICFAVWFPPDMPPIKGLMLVKEDPAPGFIPREQPTPATAAQEPQKAAKTHIRPAQTQEIQKAAQSSDRPTDSGNTPGQKEKKSFWRRLFGR